MLFVTNISIDLSWICLKKHKDNFDLDAVLPTIFKFMNAIKSTFLSDAQTCAVFVNIANKIKITCKKAANKEKNVIFKARAKKIIICRILSFFRGSLS